VDPIHRRLTFQEFEDFPQRLGWKHEYDGEAIHVTPSKITFVALRLALSERAVPAAPHVRPACPEDAPGLTELFQDAFTGAVEFAGYPPRRLREEALAVVHAHFREARNPFRHLSGVIEENGRLCAAALLKQGRQGPRLEPLFVRPRCQRRGLATVLIGHVVNCLLAAGETCLSSFCHLGNGPSLAWHLRFGFRELPDLWVVSHRAQFYATELVRRERLKELTPAQREELVRQRDYWLAERERLRLLEKQDFAAAHPCLE
jgi:GNAT superfamily N-acetyltransferase